MIKRHLRQEELDRMREASRLSEAKRDLKTRQHLMEHSFARGKWYGFDRTVEETLAGEDSGILDRSDSEY